MLVSQTQTTKYLSVKINFKFECGLLLIESKASPTDVLANYFVLLNMPVTDATLVTILGMSVYSTYAYLPAYIHNVLVYLGYTEG